MTRAEVPDKVMVLGPADCGHLGADVPRDLHGGAADLAAGAVDQKALSRQKAGLVDQEIGRRHAAEQQGHRVGIGQV